MYSYGPLQMDEQRQDDQLEPTYCSSVPIRDVALKTSLKQWTIEKGGEKGSEIFVLMAWHDDDNDDDVLICFNRLLWNKPFRLHHNITNTFYYFAIYRFSLQHNRSLWRCFLLILEEIHYLSLVLPFVATYRSSCVRFHLFIIIIIIIIYFFNVFHISVSWWSFTGVWVTASLLVSPGLSSIFWPFSIMLSFGCLHSSSNFQVFKSL